MNYSKFRFWHSVVELRKNMLDRERSKPVKTDKEQRELEDQAFEEAGLSRPDVLSILTKEMDKRFDSLVETFEKSVTLALQQAETTMEEIVKELKDAAELQAKHEKFIEEFIPRLEDLESQIGW